MTPEMLIEYIGILADSKRFEDMSFTVNLVMPEGGHTLVVRNGVVLCQKGVLAPAPDETWRTTRQGLFAIIRKDREAARRLIAAEGGPQDPPCLDRLIDSMTSLDRARFFNIVEP